MIPRAFKTRQLKQSDVETGRIFRLWESTGEWEVRRVTHVMSFDDVLQDNPHSYPWWSIWWSSRSASPRLLPRAICCSSYGEFTLVVMNHKTFEDLNFQLSWLLSLKLWPFLGLSHLPVEVFPDSTEEHTASISAVKNLCWIEAKVIRRKLSSITNTLLSHS